MLQQKEIEAIPEAISSKRRTSVKPDTFVTLVAGVVSAAGGIAMVFFGFSDDTSPGTVVAIVIVAGPSIPATYGYD